LHICLHGGKTIHALRSHMSALNFLMKPLVKECGVDLSNDAFILASRNIRGRDAVEEFVSCGVSPLAAGVSFEHVTVDFTLVSQLKEHLPRFPLFREVEEDDASSLARVKQATRNNVIALFFMLG
jgi:hypothetical protein